MAATQHGQGVWDITSSMNVVLIDYNEDSFVTRNNGGIGSISISNQHASSDAIVSLKLDPSTGNDIYIIKEVAIPAKTTLVIDGNVSFDNKRFRLVCSTGAGGLPISVIIR
jgi:hypothetical protein